MATIGSVPEMRYPLVYDLQCAETDAACDVASFGITPSCQAWRDNMPIIYRQGRRLTGRFSPGLDGRKPPSATLQFFRGARDLTGDFHEIQASHLLKP